jgi:hypothetical protein
MQQERHLLSHLESRIWRLHRTVTNVTAANASAFDVITTRRMGSATFYAADIASARLARETWELTLPASLERTFTSRQHNDPDFLKKFLKEEEAPAMRVNNARWDLLGPVGPKCRNLESYGAGALGGERARTKSINDMESKRACGLSRMPQPCNVIAIGSNGQWGFEEDVVRNARCRVHTFGARHRSCANEPG